MKFVSLFLALLVCAVKAQNELLKNADFEQNYDGLNNWWCNNCQLDKSSDAYTGSQSGQVTNRAASWAGISQYVNIQPNKKYYFRAVMKLTNQVAGVRFDSVDAMLEIDYTDNEKYYHLFGRIPHLEQAHGWQVVGGDFETGPKAMRQVRLYIQTSNGGHNYLVDSASLTEIVENPDWLTEANQRIDQIRKTDLIFAVTVNSTLNPEDVAIEVEQMNHAFPFGTAINCDRMTETDDVSKRYQDFFYDNFEMATIENALKWKQMEPTKGQIDFEKPRNAINALVERGIPVRGHCVFWEVDQFVPDWLKPMNGQQIREQITRRAKYVVEAYKGNLTHWDVNNEDLHGTFFKNQSGDTAIINTMFQEVQPHDPSSKLFLNEYQIVSEGTYTTAYLNQAKRVKSSGAPIYGVGVQSHLKGTISPAVIQKRMSIVEEAGLPVWITELDYSSTDVNARADAYEMALRLYYSNPNVEGVILWGFWDGAHYDPNCALVNGDDFVLNEAGKRFRRLIQQEWRTSAILRPTSHSEEIYLRGFQGLYSLKVKYQDAAMKTMTFRIRGGTIADRIHVYV